MISEAEKRTQELISYLKEIHGGDFDDKGRKIDRSYRGYKGTFLWQIGYANDARFQQAREYLSREASLTPKERIERQTKIDNQKLF